MEVELTYKIKKDIKYIKCDIGVRNWATGEVNGETDNFPDEQDEPRMPQAFKVSAWEWRWKPLIDIDEGRIVSWPKGTKASIYYKVCDDISLQMLDEDMKPISWFDSYSNKMTDTYEGYVPSIFECGDDGYGDYIIMKIDENGKIEDFDKKLIYQIITDEE